MSADLRALSLLQPYASAILFGGKRIENRPRVVFRVPPGGIWVAVHASLGWWKVDPDAWMRLWPGSHGLSVPFDGPLIGSGAKLDPGAFTRGALLGVAHFVDVKVFAPSGLGFNAADAASEALGPWAFGPVCYVIDDARALPTPIPCKGALGLWRVPAGHQPALRALLPEGA